MNRSTTRHLNIKTLEKLLKEIKYRHNILKNWPDAKLKKVFFDCRSKLKDGMDEYTILPEIYAIVNETIKRQLNIRPYDVQIMGATALHFGNIIEMHTGEGKTLTAVFPAILNALSGKGTHILTFNDYLAKRDAEWMLPVYNFLGLTVNHIIGNTVPSRRKKLYRSDILYTTAKEAGYDHLRSTLAYTNDEIIQTPFNYAIIDEADAILIDEARNPLVLSGALNQTNYDFKRIADFVKNLSFGEHFKTDKFKRNVFLTDTGIEKVENEFRISNLFDENNLEFHAAISLGLQASVLLTRDIDYVVKDSQVLLIDEFTGRIMKDRKWKDGLQIAVEAKEGLPIQDEGKILTMITLPHFLEKYPKKSGMTATAIQSAEEFLKLYGMETISIPPNRECKRIDMPELLFENKEHKIKTLVNDIKDIRKSGQPVLLGTLTIKESEDIASILEKNDIPCNVLNAKNDEFEAGIIANAGIPGAVTISTNMAGRGTDILLGGIDGKYKDRVIESGGLFIIGTNLHESARIDNQLRGRAGRQGDIGFSRFYVSIEDELMIKYGLQELIPRKLLDNNGDIKKLKKISQLFRHVQRIIEGQMFDLRKTHFDYSTLSEKQRIIIFNERHKYFDDKAIIKLMQEHTDKIISVDDTKIIQKARTIIFYHYDSEWSNHLSFLSDIREGIGLLRIGKLDPLREFQKYTDKNFEQIIEKIESNIAADLNKLSQNMNINLQEAGIQKPSSTWTYMVNDQPFSGVKGFNITNSGFLGF